jgi:serine/threonine protein phosphatase PrpC
LVIANLGDAQGILGRSVADNHVFDEGWHELPYDDYQGDRKCVWKQVTGVHSPMRDDERARIERANGWVIMETDGKVEQLKRMALHRYDDDVRDILKRCFTNRTSDPSSHRILQTGRVCGELSVSRALGDRDFKAAQYRNDTSDNPNRDAFDNADEHEWDSSHLGLIYPDGHNRLFVGDLISNKPDFHVALRVGEVGVTEEFLLLACDGLWDVLDAADAYRIARALLFEKQWSAKKTAGRLAELAVHLGSSDNITVVIVRFCER